MHVRLFVLFVCVCARACGVCVCVPVCLYVFVRERVSIFPRLCMFMCACVQAFLSGHEFRPKRTSVKHVFLSRSDKKRDYHGLNSLRMARVWMDDYIRLFYNHRNNLKVC